MLFDRQILYFVFLVGVQQTTAQPFRTPLNNSALPAIPSSLSASDNAIVAEATKIFSFLDIETTSATASVASSLPGNLHANHDPTQTRAAGHSASDIAWPDSSKNRVEHAPAAKSDQHHSTQESETAQIASATRTLTAATAAKSSSSSHQLSSNHIHTLSNDDSNVIPTSSIVPFIQDAKVNTVATTKGAVQRKNAMNLASELANVTAAGLTTSVSADATSATNAISILESAFSSLLAPSVVSQISSDLSEFTHSTATGTGHKHTAPTDTGRHHHTRPPFMNHTSKTITHMPTPTTHTTHHSTHTTSSTTSPAAAPTATEALGSHPISQASVIGVSTGLAAGAVLLGIAGLYLFRRKSQGKPIFGRSRSTRSAEPGVYPEVAWLYDPRMSPPGSPGRMRGNSEGQVFIPPPRPGSVEVEAANPYLSPNLRPENPSEPLLAPQRPLSREGSPNGSPSGSSGGRSRSSRAQSQENAGRLLRAISEESLQR